MPNSHENSPLSVSSNDFFEGYQQASLDFERKYQRKCVPIDENLLGMIFVRVDTSNQSDLWKIGYLAGLFASVYGVAFQKSARNSKRGVCHQ